MRKAPRNAVVLLLLLTAAAFAVWRFLAHGVSARDAPTRLEVALGRRLRHLAIPRGAREARNPVALTPEVLAEAKAHFADHCALCHANDGSGQTEIGQNLYPKAPDMRGPDTQGLSDGEIYYIIENGVRLTGMPAWGTGREGSEASWKLLHFIRRLPKLAPEEVEGMKALNPKSRHELEEEKEMEEFLAGKDQPSGDRHRPTHSH